MTAVLNTYAWHMSMATRQIEMLLWKERLYTEATGFILSIVGFD
jgi:hypothetical protein